MTQQQKKACGSHLLCLCEALESISFIYSVLFQFCNVVKRYSQVSWWQEIRKVKVGVKTDTCSLAVQSCVVIVLRAAGEAEGCPCLFEDTCVMMRDGKAGAEASVLIFAIQGWCCC